MASASLLPNSISPFRSNPPSPSPHFSSKLSFLSPSLPPTTAIITITRCEKNEKRKNPPWWDPFDEEVDPDTEYGSLYVDGKQDDDARPPNSENPDNPYGFLKFPMGYAVEVASLGSKIRGDVRRCCCVVSGGVYENLLFFPTIQLLKYRYPGVQIDIITTARGKQTYELNKNVRWANVYDPDDHFPIPAEYTDMLGIIRNRFYDMILSTKLAGFGHGAFLFMSTARDRDSYVYPNVNAAGAELFLSQTFKADTMNLAEGGFHMYEQMVDWLGRPFRSVPRQVVPPLQVSISRKVKEVVESKYTVAGVEKGKYIVVHGIESDSKASMQSGGDLDSLLPLQIWAQIVDAIVDNIRCTLLFVIPHEKERENVEEIIGDVLGDEISIVFITTPAQLAALINDSAGVIATNTAAIQLANARLKPSIGLFCSEVKAKLFVPDSEEKKCSIVASKTGKLQDIDAGAIAQALQIFDASTSEVSLALA